MLSNTQQNLFYLALYGLGSIASICVPLGIMIYQAWIGSRRKRVPVPMVLRLLQDDKDNYNELIGIPHDMVVGFLESTFHVKIVTRKNKQRPPDKELLKWIIVNTQRDHGQPQGGHYAHYLNSILKEYIPFAIFHRPHEKIKQILKKLERRERKRREQQKVTRRLSNTAEETLDADGANVSKPPKKS